MACGNLSGDDWAFAKAVIGDYCGAKSHGDRKGHFATLANVLKSCKYPPAGGSPTGNNIVMINPARVGQEQLDIFEQFMAMTDPEQKSAFYAKHSRVIKAVEGLRNLT